MRRGGIAANGLGSARRGAVLLFVVVGAHIADFGAAFPLLGRRDLRLGGRRAFLRDADALRGQDFHYPPVAAKSADHPVAIATGDHIALGQWADRGQNRSFVAHRADLVATIAGARRFFRLRLGLGFRIRIRAGAAAGIRQGGGHEDGPGADRHRRDGGGQAGCGDERDRRGGGDGQRVHRSQHRSQYGETCILQELHGLSFRDSQGNRATRITDFSTC